MAEAHAIELRKRAVEAYESGVGGYKIVAALFDVGEASVKRWVKLQRTKGDVAPTRKGGGTPSTIAEKDVASILARLRDPNAGELTAAFNRLRRGESRVHVSSMKRALHRFGYVVKKNAAGRWKVSGPMSSQSARRS